MAFYPVDQSGARLTSNFTMIQPSAWPGYAFAGPLTFSDAHNMTANSLQKEPSAIICVNSERVLHPQEALECPIDEKIRNRRSRAKFTTYQRRVLEKVFSQSQFVSMQNCHQLKQHLGISEQIIKTWFKNRRAKWRKELRETGTSTSPTSVSPDARCLCFDHVPYPSGALMMRDARMLFGTAGTSVRSEAGQYCSPFLSAISTA